MEEEAKDLSKRNIFIVTCALLLSNAMSGLDSTIVNTALPAIISDLHGIEMMGWIVAVFLLGTAVSTPLWSKLGEHIGNKQSYQLAALFFVVGSLLQGLSPNIVFLIISRTIAGIGNGGVVSLPYIIYARMYADPRKRMKVLGFVSASYSTATIIGPLVGGFIVDAFSWHWVFYLNVPIGLISAILVQIYYKAEKEAHKNKPVDYMGSILMTIGLTSLLAGIEMIGTASTLFVTVALIVAVMCIGAMIYFERGVADPIIPNRLFKNRELVIDFILFTLNLGRVCGLLNLQSNVGARITGDFRVNWRCYPNSKFIYEFYGIRFCGNLAAVLHTAKSGGNWHCDADRLFPIPSNWRR